VDSRVSDIKRRQKESLYRKEVGRLLQQAGLDNPDLQDLSVSRVSLSANKSLLLVFFFLPGGRPEFEKKLGHLTLFKPSLRKALAKRIPSRYVPDIKFQYDDQLEKELAMEKLLDKVKDDFENNEE